MRLTVALCMLFLLAGCGKTGELYLPDDKADQQAAAS